VRLVSQGGGVEVTGPNVALKLPRIVFKTTLIQVRRKST